MKVDYLIVGFGLAGICLAEKLRSYNKSFVIIEDRISEASLVAGGVYNPTVLKRFTVAWKASEQLEVAIPFFKQIENRLKIKIINPLAVHRKFASVEEQNNWFEATDKPKLKDFLLSKVLRNDNSGLNASFGFGRVLNTGKLNIAKLKKACVAELKKEEKYIRETFDFQKLQLSGELIKYKDINAKNIVFCEGYGIKNNPFFNYLPLVGNKGELLIIKAPSLKVENIVKSSVFIIPKGNDLYIVGATYNREDKTDNTTVKARQELIDKLETLIEVPYEIVEQKAGIRPTVADRRPLTGRHPKYKNMYVLNGLGTRGVMIGPWLSKKLYEFIERDISLDAEINIDRFKKRY